MLTTTWAGSSKRLGGLVGGLLLVGLLLPLGGCRGHRQSSGASAGQGTSRTIHYGDNRSVTVPATIHRIACGWPAQNAIIAMLGYGDRIVATTEVIKSVPLFRKFVPSIDQATYCFSNNDVQIEALMNAKPELLFIPDGMYGKADSLRRMGIPIAAFKSNSLQAIIDRTVATGEILGEDAHKRALAYQRYFNGNVERVRQGVGGIPKGKRVRVYHSIRDSLSTAGGHSLVQDWMDLGGAVNVAEPWFTGMSVGTVSLEQVMRADPDVIIAMEAQSAKEMKTDRRWSQLRAVRNHKVYTNPKGMFWWCRETSEEALQILWLAKTLYPDQFRDLDMSKETRNFYKTFYGYDLTDQEIHEILYP